MPVQGVVCKLGSNAYKEWGCCKLGLGSLGGSGNLDAGAAALGAPRVRGKTFAAVPDAGIGGVMEKWLRRLDG
jgi:hypothetical protein